MKTHKLANRFPEMSEEEYEALKSDIETNGLLEALTLFEGKILDGRHRYRACKELGIKPTTTKFEGTETEAIQYIDSLNLTRRHLSSGTRACMAALGCPYAQENKDVLKEAGITVYELLSKGKGAKTYGVSKASVSNARKLLKTGKWELFKAVLEGKKDLADALDDFNSNVEEDSLEDSLEDEELPEEEEEKVSKQRKSKKIIDKTQLIHEVAAFYAEQDDEYRQKLQKHVKKLITFCTMFRSMDGFEDLSNMAVMDALFYTIVVE